jgi:hypothetical protein
LESDLAMTFGRMLFPSHGGANRTRDRGSLHELLVSPGTPRKFYFTNLLEDQQSETAPFRIGSVDRSRSCGVSSSHLSFFTQFSGPFSGCDGFCICEVSLRKRLDAKVGVKTRWPPLSTSIRIDYSGTTESPLTLND